MYPSKSKHSKLTHFSTEKRKKKKKKRKENSPSQNDPQELLQPQLHKRRSHMLVLLLHLRIIF